MKKRCESVESTNCIKDKAKELWEKDGCKQGRDLEYWLQAGKIIKGQMKNSSLSSMPGQREVDSLIS